jgi:hypothetical protein
MKVAAVLTLALLVSAFTVPALAGAKQEKAFGLVVDGYQVVGNKVLVQVTNVGATPDSGYVCVRAMVNGLPTVLVQVVRLMAGVTEYVGVGFELPVDGIIELGISEGANPVG